MADHLLVACIFVLAGMIQGLSGFGSVLLAMPLLTLFLDVKTAVPLCILAGLGITGYLCLRLRAHLDLRKIGPMLLGVVPGVAAGAVFLKRADPRAVELLLGLMLTAFALYGLRGKPLAVRLGRRWGLLAGFLSGAIGAAVSAGGPPVIVYVHLTGWGRDEIKATLSGFFLAGGALIAVAHALGGLTTATVLGYALTALPAVVAGVAVGLAWAARLADASMRRAVLLLLLAMGLMMVGRIVF
jgi:hypothetical protein